MTSEIIYKGKDNPVTVELKEDGVVMDFSAVTRMTLDLIGSGLVFDSDVTASLIDWSQGSGKVVFNINDEAVAVGSYRGRLIAYDALHTDGQVLTHEKCGPFLTFEFKSA